MIHYHIRPKEAIQQYIPITLTITDIQAEKLVFTLPCWRPGRYEVSNFSRFVRGVEARNTEGELLESKKQGLHQWIVKTNGASTIKFSYAFYANLFDSGNSFLAEDLFYMNPINALFYLEGSMQEVHQVKLDLPTDYEVATSLVQLAPDLWQANDYHELADSPILASNNLQNHVFEVDGLTIRIALYGPAKPEWHSIQADFIPFIKEQRAQFSSTPISEYWFLILTASFRKYHGVEHLKSTVLTLGPGYNLMDKRYDDLVELASHEFYHLWNIKSIRPVELMPYSYDKAIPFTTGFVAEGVTVYYGDITLARSGAYSWEKYLPILAQSIQRHRDNHGRLYNTLANSSFELWLDGYSREVPDRKLSIYTDGCLLALMADLHIMKCSNGAKGLHDVMNHLYEVYALNNKGYSEQDYFDAITELAGESAAFIQELLHQPVDYFDVLEPMLNEFGLMISSKPSEVIHESRWGVKLNPGENVVVGLYPGSIAEQAGIRVGDHIMSINGYQYQQNLEDWSNFFDADEVTVRFERLGQIIPVELQARNESYYHTYKIEEIETQTADQQKLLSYWKRSSQDT